MFGLDINERWRDMRCRARVLLVFYVVNSIIFLIDRRVGRGGKRISVYVVDGVAFCERKTVFSKFC